MQKIKFYKYYVFEKNLENETWDESIINERVNELYKYCINSI